MTDKELIEVARRCHRKCSEERCPFYSCRPKCTVELARALAGRLEEKIWKDDIPDTNFLKMYYNTMNNATGRWIRWLDNPNRNKENAPLFLAQIIGVTQAFKLMIEECNESEE